MWNSISINFLFYNDVLKNISFPQRNEILFITFPHIFKIDGARYVQFWNNIAHTQMKSPFLLKREIYFIWVFMQICIPLLIWLLFSAKFLCTLYTSTEWSFFPVNFNTRPKLLVPCTSNFDIRFRRRQFPFSFEKRNSSKCGDKTNLCSHT